MGKNTSIALGEHFENFVDKSIEQGRYKNASEVIRAGLRMLEEYESKFKILKQAINEGIDSGTALDFNTDEYLAEIKSERRNG